MSSRLLPLAALAMLAACADNRFAADVTRFHMAPPSARGGVFIEPLNNADAGTLEFQTYAAAVAAELREQGFGIVDSRGAAEIVGVLGYGQATREEAYKRSPFTIGIGGGTGGGNVGIGVGTTFGVGNKKGGEVHINTLSLQVKRASDASVVWDGRAVAEARGDSPSGSLSSAVPQLADALMRDFPGPSGQTVTYKAPK